MKFVPPHEAFCDLYERHAKLFRAGGDFVSPLRQLSRVMVGGQKCPEKKRTCLERASSFWEEVEAPALTKLLPLTSPQLLQ